MESRLRVSGHPIQPMLVTLPLGLFVSATVIDLADVAGGPAFLGGVGYWTAVAGLVAVGLCVAAGMVDLWDAPRGVTRRTTILLNLVNATMAALFVLSGLIRAGSLDRAASGGLVALEVVALAVGAVGVRLGANLIRRSAESGAATTLDVLSTTGGQRARPDAAAERLGRPATR